MKAVKEAKRPVTGRGRTGRDGAMDFALKMEDAATETAAADEHVYRVIEIVGSSPQGIEAAINRPLPVPKARYAICVGSRWFVPAVISSEESRAITR